MAYTVLAVDDVQLALDTIEFYIKSSGRSDVQLLTASTKAEGLELYKTEAPDVVIADHYLPDGTGLDMVLEMLEDNPALPIIFQSTETDSVFIRDTHRATRFVDFLTKPFNPDVFNSALNYALKMAEKMQVNHFKVSQGRSTKIFEIDTFLYAETIKGESKLITYYYQPENKCVVSTQLDNMTINKFLKLSARTGAVIQSHKSYVLNKKMITGFDNGIDGGIKIRHTDFLVPLGGKMFRKELQNYI